MSASPVATLGTDPEVFEAFYRQHIEAVHHFVARRVDDPHVAADLVADIFLAAVDAASSYRPERGTPLGWLYGVARNVVAEHWRDEARRRRATQRIQGRRLLDEDSLARAEERLDAAAEARALYAALREVSEEDRAVIELVALDGVSVADAAHVLGIAPGTARVRLHRARRRLKQRLGPDHIHVRLDPQEVSR